MHTERHTNTSSNDGMSGRASKLSMRSLITYFEIHSKLYTCCRRSDDRLRYEVTPTDTHGVVQERSLTLVFTQGEINRGELLRIGEDW